MKLRHKLFLASIVLSTGLELLNVYLERSPRFHALKKVLLYKTVTDDGLKIYAIEYVFNRGLISYPVKEDMFIDTGSEVIHPEMVSYTANSIKYTFLPFPVPEHFEIRASYDWLACRDSDMQSVIDEVQYFESGSYYAGHVDYRLYRPRLTPGEKYPLVVLLADEKVLTENRLALTFGRRDQPDYQRCYVWIPRFNDASSCTMALFKLLRSIPAINRDMVYFVSCQGGSKDADLIRGYPFTAGILMDSKLDASEIKTLTDQPLWVIDPADTKSSRIKAIRQIKKIRYTCADVSSVRLSMPDWLFQYTGRE